MQVLNNKSGIIRTLVFASILALIVGVGYGVRISSSDNEAAALESVEVNKSAAFVKESYTTIKENHWQQISEEKLLGYFARGIGQLTDGGASQINDTSQLENVFKKRLQESDNPKQFPAELVDLVLRSLPPQGRSRIYTQKKEKQLAKRVQNADSRTNLYDVLGVSKDASQERIQKTYQEKKEELMNDGKSTSTEKKIAQLEYAKKVLTDEGNRNQYDTNNAEPTVFTDRISEDIVHLAIHRYNRRTLSEFEKAVNKIDTKKNTPTTLILDLRSNLGGSVGILPYLLGPFIGPDRPAYEFFQQDETETFNTKTGWLDALVPYKKVVILVDGKTQSTGELMASVLKKYNTGVVVGETTRGWGTIERVFEIENQYSDDKKYSLFMVHHLTLRADGEPIQGNGVVPEVRIGSDGWQGSLYEYIPQESIIEAVSGIWDTPPPGTEI